MLDEKASKETFEILTCIEEALVRLADINPVIAKRCPRKLYMSIIFDRLMIDTSNEECLDIATYFFNRFKNLVESVNNDILASKEYEEAE